jgi:predicted mannosyl-3-phosphoglycerate phosphatase (HAD superfamily)
MLLRLLVSRTAGLQTKLDETDHSRTLQCRYQLVEKAERSDDSAANWAVNWNRERGVAEQALMSGFGTRFAG